MSGNNGFLKGIKQIVPAMQRKDGVLFGRLLKWNQNAANKAPTLPCFAWKTCFVFINSMFLIEKLKSGNCKKVQVGNDQEQAQSKRSHYKYRGWKNEKDN